MTETATVTSIRSTMANRESTMNERIAHWKKVNTRTSTPTPTRTVEPAVPAVPVVKAAAAVVVVNVQEAAADMEQPPAAARIDSDESVCSDDSAPFPLPAHQLNKYPAAQRKQQQEANRFYNFFERYALEISEAGATVAVGVGLGVGLCGSGKGVDNAENNTDNNSITDVNVNVNVNVNQSMRNISIFDASSVCDGDDADAANTANTTPQKKGVHWGPNVMTTSCNAVDYGDFYDRYMLVVTEVGASACGGKETESTSSVTGEGEVDQSGARSAPAVAFDKKPSPTSTTETDLVDVDNNNNNNTEQVEGSEEQAGWNLNQVNCADMSNIDMQPCVGMAMAVPFNLNKFWESLLVKVKGDDNDNGEDEDDQVHAGASDRTGEIPKRRKARELSSSTLSREIDEDEEPDLDLDMGHNVVQRDSSVVNLDDVNVMMDTVIDTVLSNELKGMATEFMGKVRSMVDGEDGCPVPDKNTETETIHSENDAVSKLR